MLKKLPGTCVCGYHGYLQTKKLCKYCYTKQKLEMKKERVGIKSRKHKGKDAIEIKQKRPARKATTYCSIQTLAATVSRLTRTLFGTRCHGVCNPNKPYVYSDLECAHFCVRKHQATSYLLSNVLPTCTNCNRFTPEHVYRLGIELDDKFGLGTADLMLRYSKMNCKLSPKTRKQMNTYLKGIQARAEEVIKQYSIRSKDSYKSLLALAIEANNELLNKFIIPNLI